MAPKKYLMTRTLTFFIFLILIVLQPVIQQHSSEGLSGDREGAVLSDSSATAFLIVDVSLSGEGGVSLSWSDLGANFVYTVEYCDSLSEGNWAPGASTEPWPIGETSWTDAGASGNGTRFYRIHTEALHDPPAAPTDVTANLEDSKVVIAWSPVPGASSYNVYWSTDEEFVPLDANTIEGVTSPFAHTALTFDVTYYYVVTAVGNKGESEVSSVVSATPVSSLDPTVATTLAAASELLYTGPDPIQAGVEEGTIEPHRVAVLRGKVLTREGEPLSGVTITVLNRPEYGQTRSREDGMFDMAANGGGFLTVDYQKDGYLPAQRQVNVPWQDYVWLPDVVLIQEDSQVTTIDLSAPTEMQVARGSVQSDDDGTRQATVLFPLDTQAEMLMPDGSTQAITTLNVRATEYTVGSNGPEAMPAELPPTSFYTYCVEFNADEAQAAGAEDVLFSQPLHFYLENFLGFPAGIQVPVGCYDRTKGVWVPSPDGKVIKILSITGGMADLDTDGDEAADDAATLEALGITDAEREKLADLYSAGQGLWRVPVPHFSQPYDCNYGTVPESGAGPFTGDPATTGDEDNTDKPCQDSNWGTIEFQNQVFKEAVSVTGTPFRLHYSSDRVAGHAASHMLNIPVSNNTVPSVLKRIELEVLVAGRRFTESLPAAPDQSYTFLWDGKDAYGRFLQGEQPVTVRIGYVYNAYYALPPSLAASFAFPSGRRIPGDIPARQEITLWHQQLVNVRIWDARSLGLGGWTLAVHHSYDPQGRVLYIGDGRRRTTENMNSTIRTIAGSGVAGDRGDGGPAVEAWLYVPIGIAFGSDGSLYIADRGNRVIRRVAPDGIITRVAGSGRDGDSGDGGPALDARFRPEDVDVGPDGGLYIADEWASRVRRVGPDGIIHTVAGNGEKDYSGDGGLATRAGLTAREVAVAPDGSFYIADTYNHRVRRVGPDGVIHTVAGTGESGYGGDGGPARQAKVEYPTALALAPDGSLYIAEGERNRVRRVGPDGIIHTVAGNGEEDYSGDGGPATEAGMDPYGISVGPDGSLYITDHCCPV